MPAYWDPAHFPQLPTSSCEITSQLTSPQALVFAPPVVRVSVESWNVNTRPSDER